MANQTPYILEKESLRIASLDHQGNIEKEGAARIVKTKPFTCVTEGLTWEAGAEQSKLNRAASDMLERLLPLCLIPLIILTSCFSNMSKVSREPPHPILVCITFREKQIWVSDLIAMESLISKPGMLITLTCHDALGTKFMKSLMKATNTCKEIYERWLAALFHALIEHIQPALKRGFNRLSLNPTCAENPPQAG